MNTTNEHRHKLVAELIEQSAKIDVLVAKCRQPAAEATLICSQDLEELRAKQRATTQQLHSLEEYSSNPWENIGDGG